MVEETSPPWFACGIGILVNDMQYLFSLREKLYRHKGFKILDKKHL